MCQVDKVDQMENGGLMKSLKLLPCKMATHTAGFHTEFFPVGGGGGECRCVQRGHAHIGVPARFNEILDIFKDRKHQIQP